MHDLPLSHLRALAAVYETGGIRPAGRELRVAHSAISRHLRELEALLDTPLFEANSRRGQLAFTPQGKALGKAALAACRDLELAVTSVREAHRGNSLVVATTASFAVRWLLPRLHEFHAAHPPYEVSVVVDQQVRSPLEHGADLNIRMGGRPSEAGAIPLMDDCLFPVASPNYLRTANGEDALSWSLLHDRDPNASWSNWKAVHGPGELDVRKGARFTSSDLVLRAAEQGFGVALARGRLAEDALQAGTLVRLYAPGHVLLRDAYYIITNKPEPYRLCVRSFVEWLKKTAARECDATSDKKSR
ncbi:MAG: LysR substrate-binding domain-containing protein [Stappiaceae bacterium]